MCARALENSGSETNFFIIYFVLHLFHSGVSPLPVAATKSIFTFVYTLVILFFFFFLRKLVQLLKSSLPVVTLRGKKSVILCWEFVSVTLYLSVRD